MLTFVGRSAMRVAGLAARALLTGSATAKAWVILGIVAAIVVLGPTFGAVADVGAPLLVIAALVAIVSVVVRG